MFERLRALPAAAALFAATVAAAGPAPILAPPAPWVLPPAPSATPPPADGAPARTLLWDEQLRLGEDGGQQLYVHTVARLQTAQGVQGAGALALPWNPETGDLTIHWLRVIRDGKARDVLATQSFQVLHRESNLEASVIDGVLTAAIQPDDLRVGDTVDLAFTLSNRDPALAGHAQAALAIPNMPIDSLRLAVSAPKGRFAWRANAPLDGLPKGLTGMASRLDVAMTAVQPLQLPEGAPARFLHPRELEISDFTGWAQASAVLAPAFEAAATIRPGSPLAAEVARIAALSADPKIRAQAALALTQDQVRYLALNIHDGGLLPADAETTWSRRFGDCKGKTVLLVALLRALGVTAQPALVSTTSGDGLDGRLPSLAAFDHVIVRAQIGDRVYWLDGARTGDRRLDDIEVPGFLWALPMQASGGALARLVQAPLARPAAQTSLRLDASEGLDLPAPAHAETVLRGDAAIALDVQLGQIGASLDQALRAYWRKIYDFVTPTKVAASFDPQTNEERLTLDGTAAMAWQSQTGRGRLYEADGAGLGWKADFTREPGPNADAPFAVDFPGWDESSETIVLPHGGEGFRIEGGDIDRQIAGRAFLRKASIAKGVFEMTASARSLAPEFPGADAPAAARALLDLSKSGLAVRAPSDYRPTDKEVAALTAVTPRTADAFIDRGLVFMHAQKNAQAASDFEAATKLDPKSSLAFADLSLARLWMGDIAGARVALASARVLDSRQPIAFQAAGVLALRDGDPTGAATAFSQALEANPADRFSREERARAYASLGDFDRALTDLDILLQDQPDDLADRSLRVGLYEARGQMDKALADADAAVALAPDRPQAHVLRGGTLALADRTLEAMAEFSRAIAISPTVEAYVTRARYRPDSDLAGKLADYRAAAALGLDADRARLLEAQAEAKGGAADQAVVDADLVVKARPTDVGVRLARATIYAQTHRPDLAAADFDWLRARPPATASDWNTLCWDEATLGVSLDLALADCDKAVAGAPQNPAHIDSRAFVLLRLGRLAEAIAAYDDALRLRPTQAASLYGRGVAETRAGDKARGQADLAAARAQEPSIDKTFAGYGVTP